MSQDLNCKLHFNEFFLQKQVGKIKKLTSWNKGDECYLAEIHFCIKFRKMSNFY